MTDVAYVSHTGIKGMRWGIRRYQNPDGSLTEAGKRHYAKTGEYGYHYKSRFTKRAEKRAAKYDRKANEAESKGKADKAARLREKQRFNEGYAKYNREIDRRMQDYAKGARGIDLLLSKANLTTYAVANIKPTDPLVVKASKFVRTRMTQPVNFIYARRGTYPSHATSGQARLRGYLLSNTVTNLEANSDKDKK